MKQADREEILAKGERAEAQGYELLSSFLNRLVRGLFVFKTRKGELVAASSTFFAVMSFCPLILLVISLYGKLIGNSHMATEQVFVNIRANLPNVSPWILDSIEKIVMAHIAGHNSYNWINIVLLLYTSMGFAGTLLFGINTLARVESRGGKFFEDGKAFLTGSFLGCFFVFFLLLGSPQLFETYLEGSKLGSVLLWGLDYNIIQSLVGLLFFSVFYKWSSPSKIRVTDAILAATCFVGLFLLGKTFYWVYLHYFKADLIKTFGNFHGLIVAVLWIYYLFCSFFFGASVALAPLSLRQPQQVPSMPNIEEDVA